MENFNSVKQFNIDDYVINVQTKDIYKIIDYHEEIEYRIHGYYLLKNLETENIENYPKSYMVLRMESLNSIEDKIDKYNKIINGYTDDISDLRWLTEEFKNKLKQYDITEGDAKR